MYTVYVCKRMSWTYIYVHIEKKTKFKCDVFLSLTLMSTGPIAMGMCCAYLEEA